MSFVFKRETEFFASIEKALTEIEKNARDSEATEFIYAGAFKAYDVAKKELASLKTELEARSEQDRVFYVFYLFKHGRLPSQMFKQFWYDQVEIMISMLDNSLSSGDQVDIESIDRFIALALTLEYPEAEKESPSLFVPLLSGAAGFWLGKSYAEMSSAS